MFWSYSLSSNSSHIDPLSPCPFFIFLSNSQILIRVLPVYSHGYEAIHHDVIDPAEPTLN